MYFVHFGRRSILSFFFNFPSLNFCLKIVGLDIVFITHINKRIKIRKLYAVLTLFYIGMLAYRLYVVMVRR